MHKRLMVLLTVIIAASTAYSGWIFNLQLNAMRGQLEEMKSSSKQVDQSIQQFKNMADANAQYILLTKSQARARLSIKYHGFETSSKDNSLNIDIDYKNVGTTQAQKIYYAVNMSLFNFPLSQSTPISELDLDITSLSNLEGGYVLQPSQEMTTVAHGKPPAISKLISAFKADKLRFYFAGTILFDDIFGEHHWNRFCHSYDYNNYMKLINNETSSPDLCPMFNDSD